MLKVIILNLSKVFKIIKSIRPILTTKLLSQKLKQRLAVKIIKVKSGVINKSICKAVISVIALGGSICQIINPKMIKEVNIGRNFPTKAISKL